MLEFGTLLYRVPALLIALTVHEYAHAQAAYALGDPTPRFQGRLTMNPLAHIDPLGALMLVLVGFGWAKPVEFNPNNFGRRYREGILKVALAGPASNLFMCFLSLALYVLLMRFGLLTDGVYTFLRWNAMYNVWFAFFNLVPVPPLDGSQILAQLLPPNLAWKYQSVIGRYGFLILVAVCFTGLVNYIIAPLGDLWVRLCMFVLSPLM